MSNFSEQEIWKNIKEFPDYQISNWGRVKKCLSQRINKGSLNASGYPVHRFYFYDEKGQRHLKDVRIHLIVAKYFAENEDPENYQKVIHKDGNKLNVHATNLQWVKKEEIFIQKKEVNLPVLSGGKPICEYDLKGSLIRIWKNATFVAKVYPIASRTIHDPCTYRTKTAYGRQWRYYETTQGKGIPSVHLRPYDLNVLNNKLKTKFYNHDVDIPSEYLFSPDSTPSPVVQLEYLINHSSLTALQKQTLREIQHYIVTLESKLGQIEEFTPSIREV